MKKGNRLFCLVLTLAALLSVLPPAQAACNHADDELMTSYPECVRAYDNGNDTHVGVYVTVYAFRCRDCGEIWEVRGGDEKAEVEPHNPGRSVYCLDCGAYVRCIHAPAKVAGKSDICVRVFDNGSASHTRVLVTSRVWECPDCGLMWEVFDQDERTCVNEHSYDAGGRCTICGAWQANMGRKAEEPVIFFPSGSLGPDIPGVPAERPSGGARPAGVWLVPDSGGRQMTEAECWDWTYEALGFVYHEILARHGFIFDQNGSYAWYFAAQPWYRPDASRNNQAVYDRLNDTEWHNVNLIKSVRRTMKDQGTENPYGRPAPGGAGHKRLLLQHKKRLPRFPWTRQPFRIVFSCGQRAKML